MTKIKLSFSFSVGLNVEQLRADGLEEKLIGHMKSSGRKGNFFLSTSLESMPQETVVSPHLMDFLMETLEEIPHAQHFLPQRTADETKEDQKDVRG